MRQEVGRKNKKIMFFSVLIFLVIAVGYLAFACGMMIYDKMNEPDLDLQMHPKSEAAAYADSHDSNAVKVTVGTYMENIKEISMKDSEYRISELVWFCWNGENDLDMANNFRIYKGTINTKEIVKESHENGVNYQLVRIDVTISDSFKTRRYPLETHLLSNYVESNYTVEKVVFTADKDGSGINGDLGISGFKVMSHNVSETYYKYGSTHGDPELTDGLEAAELCTLIYINRDGLGLYAKCFIALLGTLAWCLIALFINTNHRVDPLSMMPALLLGTVSNIMVGANLVPDSLQLGLLEFVNVWGIFIIIAASIVIINVNLIRNHHEDRAYAAHFGRVMFALILSAMIIGNIVLPLAAYRFN